MGAEKAKDRIENLVEGLREEYEEGGLVKDIVERGQKIVSVHSATLSSLGKPFGLKLVLIPRLSSWEYRSIRLPRMSMQYISMTITSWLKNFIGSAMLVTRIGRDSMESKLVSFG